MLTKKARIDDMAIRADSKSKSGRLLGYCAKRDGIKGIALLDGNQECLGFVPLEKIQQKIEQGPFIEV